MELWTENHQILAWSSEYLAGQLYPDEVFPNNGQTGRWHMEHAAQKIQRWIDWRARTGMAEWDSVVYYNMDFSALLNLVDFAQDNQIALQATMMVDLLFFDIAVDFLLRAVRHIPRSGCGLSRQIRGGRQHRHPAGTGLGPGPLSGVGHV